MKLTTVPDGPTTSDDTDVQVNFSVTDVRCLSSTSYPCVEPNANPGYDYVGYLNPVVTLRVTDRYNLPSPAGRDPGTAVDSPLLFSVVCTPTVSTSIGSTCSTSTTLNAVYPGIARKNRRSVWEIAETRVLDGGAGGVKGFGGTVFLRQGIFVP
jgi:hypothetical protein